MQQAANLRSRRILARDAGEVAQILRAQTHFPPDLSAILPSLLQHLIAADRVSGPCVETGCAGEDEGDRKIVAFGLSGFVDDPYAETLLADPPQDFALDILQRCRSDESCVLLGPEAIARANGGDGLNLVPFVWAQRPAPPGGGVAAELGILAMRTFLDFHRGYRLKGILKEARRAQEMAFLGGGLMRLKQLDSDPGPQGRLLFGLTREQARANGFASAIGMLFATPPPRLGLNWHQQQVLGYAVEDHSDEEIANQLGLTSHAINMRWRTTYDRIRERPELEKEVFGRPDHRCDAANGQKRRRLIAFVRAHPEELRPYQK